MSIIKCKMCGGDLIIEPGNAVAECEYCGIRQTIPMLDDEKKLMLFARANRLRAACEFDKVAGIYESIIADFPEEAEAYWGLVLCKYGIEYVDDPATGKKIPTCHRSSFDSVMEDSDFEQACENADTVARKVYREEAKQIEEIRKGIIEVSGKEEPYDIFICYKETDENGDRTLDSVIAQDVYDALVSRDYRVFFSRITLEDKLGQEYEPYIFAALNSAKIMLAFGTDYEYYNAVWVKNEWSRFLKLMASDKTKHLIPCYKNIDAYDMPKEFAKLQAQDMGKVGAIQDLLRGIEKLLTKKQHATMMQEKSQIESGGGPGTTSLLRRGELFLEDCDWENADIYFDKVLDMNPECAEAYLGKLMAELQISKREELAQIEKLFDRNGNYQKALRFGSEELKSELIRYDNTAKERKEQELQEKKHREQQERVQKNYELKEIRNRLEPANKIIASGNGFVIGLKLNGTVVAVGKNDYGQCEVDKWRNIVAVSAGNMHSVGLRSNGTVVSVGKNIDENNAVGDWKDIVAISAGEECTLGLKSDGTVMAAGNIYNIDDVKAWKDIVAISVGNNHTVGLKSDGTVIAVGYNGDGECDVNGWKDIVAISAGNNHTVGLKSDGTVVTTGEYCGDISAWRDVVAISVGNGHTIGLKSDGTVVREYNPVLSSYNLENLKDIVAISTKLFGMVGLKSDGTVKTAGTENWKNQCDVKYWKLFNNLDSLEKDRIAETEEFQKKEKSDLETELANLKGLFNGKRRREIESQLAEIEKGQKNIK